MTDAAKPDAAKPDAAKPDAAKPDAAKPDAAKPDAAKPDAAKPDAAKPDTAKPDAARKANWKRAKRWPGWALLAVVVVGLLVIAVNNDSGPRSSEERIEQISKRLACPICDGESVFESRNNASATIRTEIRAQVLAGERSNDEIISYFVQRNSRLLLVPQATGIEALAWALPMFAFVCALAGLTVAFRRWKQAADTVPTDDDRELVAAALAKTRPDEIRPDEIRPDES